jgi:DNA gyrase subunit A
VALTDGKRHIMLCSDAGKAIKFTEEEVRPMGRTAAGVRGIKLQEGQQLIGLIIADEGGAVLSVTEHGYGKRTEVGQYPLQGRGGQGVVSIQTNERNGRLVGAVRVTEEDEIMLISDGGILVRTAVSDISIMGRNTQGVRLIRLNDGEKLVEVERIDNLNGDADDEDAGVEADSSLEESADSAEPESEDTV